MVYFAVTIKIGEEKGRGEYDAYIHQVKPIVESYGGRYLIRSENITPLDSGWHPNRFILIEFPTRDALNHCFDSKEYHKIAYKRINSVNSQAIIIEEEVNENL
ncbi:Uncharacterized conserved protein [uncultured Eubacterium sp.]|nr:Uncharacterized conserved protein [uncultured Eubacterium sp.]